MGGSWTSVSMFPPNGFRQNLVWVVGLC